MKLYLVNGVTRLYEEGKAPAGAILITKAKPAPKVEEPEDETPKAAEPKVKARKAENNK